MAKKENELTEPFHRLSNNDSFTEHIEPQIIDNILVIHNEKPTNLTVQTINLAIEVLAIGLKEEDFEKYHFPAQYETRVWLGYHNEKNSKILCIYGSDMKETAIFIHAFLVNELKNNSTEYLDQWLD